MGKAVKWTGNILLALVVLALLFFFLTPHLMGISFFTIYSGSMSPVIPVGSVIVVQPVAASSIELGDIITFGIGTDEKNMVTHRVVEVMADYNALSFRTAGDANEGPDNRVVSQEDIIGKVWFHVPGLGYLSSFVSTRMGFIWLMAVPALCIILLEIRSIIIELRSMRDSSHWQPVPVALTEGLERQRLLTAENLQPVEVAEGAPPLIYPIYMEDTNQIKLIESETQQPVLPDKDSHIEPVAPITEVTGVTHEDLVSVSPAELEVPLDIITEPVTPMGAVKPRIHSRETKSAEIETEAARIVAEIVARIRASKEGAVTRG